MNSAFGYNALPALTTASNNTGVGANTLSALTTGNNNDAAGSNAGHNFSTANDSVAIGYFALNTGNATTSEGTVCVDTNSDDSATSCIASESDARLKTNIRSLSASTSLDIIDALNPVAFDWRATDPEVLKHYPLIGRFASSTHSIGLIAQQVMPVLPEALSLETVGDKDVQYYQLDYTKFIPHLIGAIQEVVHIGGAFKENLVVWLGSTANGIDRLFAREIVATTMSADIVTGSQKLCIGQTCVTEAQLQAMLAASASAPGAQQSAVAASAPASLTLNGNNPVAWQSGQAWQDNLGALFMHDGQSETIYSTSTVDTTQSGTTTIDYWAFAVSAQQWLHASRDVAISSPANNGDLFPILSATGTDPAAAQP